MHRDTVIGIVGVVILVAAMIGVFTYERGQAGDLANDDESTTGNFTATLSGTSPLGEDQAEPQVMTVNQSGLTSMTFTLTWSPGSQTSVDTMRLVVVMPNNMSHESEPSNTGEITLTVDIPAGEGGADLGMGDWQIIAAFVDADLTTPVGNPPVPPPTAPPGSTDTSVSWSVAAAGSSDAPSA